LTWVALRVFYPHMRPALLTALLTLAACAHLGDNAYAQFYSDNLGDQRVDQLPDLVVPTGEPKIYRGGDLDTDNQKMLQNGFVEIGSSAFNNAGTTPAENVDLVRKFARTKQADTVLFYTQFTSTLTEQVPYTVVTGESSTTWTRFDRRGNEHDRTDTSQTYETGFNQVQTDRYDYTATYWVKKKTRTDEQMTASAKTQNGLFSVIYPPSFIATNLNANVLQLRRTIDDGSDETLAFEAYAKPISTDLKEFSRIAEDGAHKVWPGFVLRSTQQGSCYGAPGIVTTGTFRAQNGVAQYWSYACDAIVSGVGVRAAFVVPVTHASDHEDMLLRLIGGAKVTAGLGGTVAESQDLTQTYTTSDGRFTVHYPPEFAASPQADGSLAVQRNNGEVVMFRPLSVPPGAGLNEVAAQAWVDTKKRAAGAGIALGATKEESGTCNGSPATFFSYPATLKGATYQTWHCVIVRDGAAYAMGYSVPDALAGTSGPLLRRIIESATIAKK
jgi:hypothetical protein